MTGRNKVPDEVKAFIVTSLACFDAPSVVVARVKAEFGISVSRQAVEKYDPDKRAGANLSPKWRQLHSESRSAFKTDLSAIGISHRAVRLRALERMAQRAEESKTWF